MHMKKRRLLTIILAGIMTMSMFVSCSESDVNSETKETQQSEVVSDSGETSAETEVEEEQGYYNSMPAIDFDGWAVNMAGGYGDQEVAASMAGVCDHITMDGITGDEFDDDLYNRVVAINDKYNIEFTAHDVSTDDAIMLSVTSGTQDYQLGADLYNDMSYIITGNYAYPLTDISTLQFDMPYWDQGARKALTVNNVMYYCMSDMSFSHYDSAALLFYNGALLTDNQITTSPYDLYKEGKWTTDQMFTMMETVAKDLNGDGKFVQDEDILGLTGRQLADMPLLNASETDYFMWDNDAGTFKLSMSNERIMKVGEWSKKFWRDSGLAGDGDDHITTFKSDKVLFESLLLGSFRLLREKEDDYGIVPWPSIEENMNITVHVRNPTAVIVAAQIENAEDVGTIIEAFASYAYDYIIEDYIQKAVIGKGTRDQESADVIRSVMDKRAYDVKFAFGIQNLNMAWEKAVKKGSYASVEQSMQASFEKSVSAALEPYYPD